MQREEITPVDDPAAAPGRKLLVGGLARLEPAAGLVTLRRGMPVRSKDGVETGAVAAVVVDLPGQEVTHFLLGHVPPTAVYHLAPLNLIDRIDGETVWLRVTNEEIAALPIHQPDAFTR